MKISHLVSTLKILTEICALKLTAKIKKTLLYILCSMFISERVLTEHREVYLKINGQQPVKLRSDSIEFKNYFK